MAMKASNVWRFLRNCLTGGVATIVYFVVYLPLYHVLELPQSMADNVGLALGATVQFLGARYFVFRARQGAMHKQIAGFVFVEFLTLLANMALLFGARLWLPAAIGQSDLLVLATSFLVFAVFSYPAWHLVFRPPQTKTAPEGAVP